jgi:hypothetical protein
MGNVIYFDYWPALSETAHAKYKIMIATNSRIPEFVDREYDTFYRSINGFVSLLDQYKQQLNLETLQCSSVNLKENEKSEIEKILCEFRIQSETPQTSDSQIYQKQI